MNNKLFFIFSLITLVGCGGIEEDAVTKSTIHLEISSDGKKERIVPEMELVSKMQGACELIEYAVQVQELKYTPTASISRNFDDIESVGSRAQDLRKNSRGSSVSGSGTSENFSFESAKMVELSKAIQDFNPDLNSHALINLFESLEKTRPGWVSAELHVDHGVKETLNKSLFQGQKAVRRLVDASFFRFRGFEVAKLA